MENFIADQVDLIRRQVGDKKSFWRCLAAWILCGGGFAAQSYWKTADLRPWNQGLLRKGEPEQVVEVFRNQMKANLVYVDASERFSKNSLGFRTLNRSAKLSARNLSGFLKKKPGNSRESII